MEEHIPYMRRCLQLAALALGEAAPNPMVGAVVVHQGTIIGEGYHHRCGEAHAEVNAIASVKNRTLLRDSTLYVSLEPCNHHGRTPACTDLILKLGIPRVVVAVQDPFPKVNGSGITRLRSEGVEVITGVLEQEAAWLNRRFFQFHRLRRPYLILKWAMSSDGYVDLSRTLPSQALRISRSNALRYSHRWRTEEDAILVGAQTALLDDPSLTARHWEGRNPIRVVPDLNLRLPVHLKLFTDPSAPTILLTDSSRLQDASLKFVDRPHVRVVGVESSERGTFDPEQLMSVLYHLDIQSLIVEGGPRLLRSFLDVDLWDEIRMIRSRTGVRDLAEAQFGTDAKNMGIVVPFQGIPAPEWSGLSADESMDLGTEQLEIYYNTALSSNKCSIQ